jgi:hypothetical protein
MDDLQAVRDELDQLQVTFELIRGNIARVEDMPRAITELQQENRALRLDRLTADGVAIDRGGISVPPNWSGIGRTVAETLL